MNPAMLLYPLMAQLLLIFMVLFITGKRRFFAAKAGKLPLKQVKTMQLNDVDESLIVCGRNFDNQFQLPMLFFILVLFCSVYAVNSLFLLMASWGFVITRYGHSYIHLTTNNVKQRFYIFGIGALILLAG